MIGGGAAGCLAAWAAARAGAEAVLLEALERPAKKILATGNGRCNLTNLRMDPAFYYTDDPACLGKVLEALPPRDLMALFEKEGILFHDRKGYVYPRTDQAQTIEAVLNRMLEESGVQVRTKARAGSLRRVPEGFVIGTEEGPVRADRVILTTGGKAGPGCLGDGYAMAASLGHRVLEPLPGLCPLKADKKRLKPLAGIRCSGRVRLYENGHFLGEDTGEVQFTSDTLSGIPVFNISRLAAEAFRKGGRVEAGICFLPEMEEERALAEIGRRLKGPSERTLEAAFLGLVQPGILRAVLGRAGFQNEQKLKKTDPEVLRGGLMGLMDFRLPLSGTAGFARAQVTAGGVPLAEVRPDTLESALVPGLYLAGEILNADGICGGYNLQWAFASGLAAGRAASDRKEEN